jgi:GNAT superfamily N-acetyltransferase
MKNHLNLIIAPLNAAHNKKDFHCNVESLDRYIHKQARQDIKRCISRIFVASFPDRPEEIMGYYSLSTLSIDLSQLPEKMSQKLPKHPIPAALIGRLAVSKNAQKCGIGKMLLVDAIKRTLSVTDQIAIYAMVVDSVNDTAIEFYEQFGFIGLNDDRSRLFLPLKSFELPNKHRKI